MKRRSFLQALGLGVAATQVPQSQAKSLLAELPETLPEPKAVKCAEKYSMDCTMMGSTDWE